MDSLRGALAALITGIAASLVVVALAILPFLSPPWVAFAQDRAEAAAWTGFAPADLRTATNAILVDLVIGPPNFDVAIAGAPVLKESERSHMRDVRGVFGSFFLVAAGAGIVLVGAWALARGRAARARFWRRLERTGVIVAVVTVVGGAAGMLAFDTVFTIFHEIFFPGGNWQFDARTDRLVQLFPESFWVESTVAVGVTVVVLALAMAWLGRRRAAAATTEPDYAAAADVSPSAAR
jgi:integral membrane protein (TIGR01906 family)